MKAYVLINVRGGKTREVNSKVQKIDGIKSANACWGRPDIFAFAEVKDDKALVRAMIRGVTMIVRGTSSRGTLTIDTYSLRGFTAAHEAIGVACKVK